MKLSVSQESLARGLGIVGRAVATRSTLPILSNICLTAEKDSSGERLKLAATNLEVGIIHSLDADVEQAGAITIPARPFTEYVAGLPNNRIDLELNERTATLHVKCARHEANFKGVAASEFPAISTGANGRKGTISPSALGAALAHTLISVSKDNALPALGGIQFQPNRDSITLAAADGFRLSVYTAPLVDGAEIAAVSVGRKSTFKPVIPLKAMADLARLLAALERQSANATDEQPVELRFAPDETQVFFDTGATLLVAQVIAGNFPDYTQILPKSCATTVMLSAKDLSAAVKAALVFAREASDIVRLEIPAGQGTVESMTVAGTSAETGDSCAVLEANVTGPAVQIAFNGKMLAEWLNVIGAETVVLELGSHDSPGVFRAAGLDNAVHVIMPMHLGR